MQEKLSDSYEVRAVRGVSPRIRITGISEDYTRDTLLDCLVKLNSSVFLSDSECKIISFLPTKKNKEVFQAVLQIDKSTYERAIDRGHLLVGYDSCRVYEAVEVFRCYRCNTYNHSSKSCSSPVSCPRCSGPHDVKHCTSTALTCSNCTKLNNGDSSVSVNHAVWDIGKCTAYIQVCNKLRNDILLIPGQ